MANKINHLNIVNFGLALGITWGVSMFALGIAAWLSGWGSDMVNVLSSLYIGYDATFFGSVIGMIWGFFDCFIGGVIIAWLYNLLTRSNDTV